MALCVPGFGHDRQDQPPPTSPSSAGDGGAGKTAGAGGAGAGSGLRIRPIDPPAVMAALKGGRAGGAAAGTAVRKEATAATASGGLGPGALSGPKAMVLQYVELFGTT